VSKDLLRYYDRELSYIRSEADAFARANPSLASQLRLDASGRGDPYVERLIEAFAFMSARTRLKIDDDFPMVSGGLLGLLAPHYLHPIPSMSIARFTLDPAQAGLANGYTIERGRMIETELVEGQSCRFTTVTPVRLLPFEIKDCRLVAGASAPAGSVGPSTPSSLVVTLVTFARTLPFSDLPLSELEFFLAGQPHQALSLFELMLGRSEAPAVMVDGKRRDASLMLEPGGFSAEDAAIPGTGGSMWAFRMLSEYFAMSERFRFVRIQGLTPDVLRGSGAEIQLVVPLKEHRAELERSVNAGSLAPFCSAVVNLFQHDCDLFRMTGARTRYRVVPDARRPDGIEIYSIDRVTAVTPGAVEHELDPAFRVRSRGGANHPLRWHAEPAVEAVGDQRGRPSQTDLLFVDKDFTDATEAGLSISVSATCSNHQLPRSLPFGGDRPSIKLAGGGPINSLNLLVPPTPMRRPPPGRSLAWRLVSHLSLGRLAIASGEEGAAELRHLLELYDYIDSPETLARIAGIRSIDRELVLARVGSLERSSLAQGTELRITFDAERYKDRGLYQFAVVLEHVFGLLTPVNSFTRVRAIAETPSGLDEIGVWPERVGSERLV